MLVIGVTGGIASGKSTIVSLLKRWGADVIDVDKLGWKILEEKQDEIVKEFGKEILRGEKIDRKKLGKLVFSDSALKKKLDSNIHPPLLRELKNLINSSKSKYLVVDCALIYEWGIEDWFNKIILVTATYKNKIARLLKLGYTREEAKNRIKAQLPDKSKTPTWIIKNDSDFKTLKQRTKKIWDKIINKGESHF
jgi:dephospho-CoA kinase